MSRRPPLAPPDAANDDVLKGLRDKMKGRWRRGAGIIGSPWDWRGQVADSARFFTDGYVVVDGAVAQDLAPLRSSRSPYRPGEFAPVPEARVASLLAEAAVRARNPARLSAIWRLPPRFGEDLHAFRFDGPDGRPLADVSGPRFTAVLRALGRWSRAACDGAGQVVLWVDDKPAALLAPIPTGLPELGPGTLLVGGPPRPPAPPRAPLPRAPRSLDPAARGAWVEQALDEVTRHFGGVRFAASALRPAHWAVPTRDGVLRFELMPPLAGGGWATQGATEALGAHTSRPPSFIHPQWQVVASWEELPADVSESLAGLALPGGERPPAAELAPPPAPGEHYQVVPEGARWALADARRGGEVQRGAWASLPHAKATARRMNAADTLAASSRMLRLYLQGRR